MHNTCITMHWSIVFLATFAFVAATPTTPTLHAADQELLQRQQDVIYLLENIVGELPYAPYHEIGLNYEFEPFLQNYENPNVVRYYVGLVKSGHVQPIGTPYSSSVSELRKEVSLLTQIFLGAKDYQTFLNTAAWARVHVNVDQFVTAFSVAVLQRHDMHGVILPPAYEVYPHYFFDSRIIQKVHDYFSQHHFVSQGQGEQVHDVHHIYVNYSSHLPYGENHIAYFTEDIGLSAYYHYVHLASSMFSYGHHDVHSYGQSGIPHSGEEVHSSHIGHGARFYYIHQQLLARYNLERLGQGLSPIKHLDDYYEHIETPFHSHLSYINGANFPGRGEHIYITARHHNYDLVQLVRQLESRIRDAIDIGHVITPQGAFLSLYQPQGLNILGELIEGTGHSINPRFYGHYYAVAKQLLGDVPEFHNIWEYTPAPLEHAATAVRDPIFYQLFSKILDFFYTYQKSLPAYQYNDVFVPGVSIEKVEVGDLISYFSDFEVDLNNAVAQPVGHHHESQPFPHAKAHLKRLDHKQYEYSIHVQAEKPVPGAVVRVYVGPKYNYDGQPIDINEHRHYFFELDQFVYDLIEGHNVIVRNSHQATGQSYDFPSVQQIKERIGAAIRSQNPHFVIEPQELFGFPARLTLPKGSHSGFPLQFFVIISSGVHHHSEHYGPVVHEEFANYDPDHYQVVGVEEYEQHVDHPVENVHGLYQSVDVVPEFSGHIATQAHYHWGYLYKKYPGSYYYPHWQQTHYNVHGAEHEGEHHSGWHSGSPIVAGRHGDVSHGYGQISSAYSHPVQHGEGVSGGIHHGVYGQGVHHSGHGQESHYQGSGHYSGVGGESHGVYQSGTYQGWQGHEQYLHNYYANQHIGAIIGGAVSLDGRPLGFPFDRPLAASAFYAHNIHVHDVVVYHHDEFFPEY